MGNVDDIRKAFQDIIAPDVKALDVKVDALRQQIDLKVDALEQKTDLKLQLLSAKIDSNHATVMNALTTISTTLAMDKRLDAVERELKKERPQ